MLTKTDLYFLTIAQTGNLNLASRELYVSQPSLSKYIQRLENQLGAPLFDRSSSPMKLNEAGTLYLRHLMDCVEREQQLMDQLQELSGEIRGTLRIGMPPYFGQCYLPKILPAFTAEFPHVAIDLQEGMGKSMEQALLDQKLDLAIIPCPVEGERLHCVPLLKEKVVYAARRKNGPVSTPDEILLQKGDISMLQKQAVILPHPQQKIRRIVTDFLQTANITPEVYAETQNVITTLSMAAAGICGGFVPLAGLDTVAGSIITQLSFYDMGAAMQDLQFMAVTRKHTECSRFARRFLELFQEG